MTKSEHQDTMEYIWEGLPKCKDGQSIKYLPGDIPYLYNRGFVDAQKYTYEQWAAAFEPFKDKDGNFVLNKDEFLSLRKYRFNGPAYEAFDPYKLRPGPWPDDELAYLFERSIKNSCTISKQVFFRSIEALKKQGSADENGQLFVDDKVKKQLKYLLEKYPTPRRKLELEVEKIRKERDKVHSQNMKDRDASGFTIGESDKEAKAKDFKSLESKKADEEEAEPAPTEEETIDLKSLKKPTGKFRG